VGLTVRTTRVRPLAATTIALLLAGCSSTPSIASVFAQDGGTVELGFYGVATMSTLNVCGIKQKDNKSAEVPYACLLPHDTPLEPRGDIESRPVSTIVESVLGSTETFKLTVTLDVIEQRRLVEGALLAVAAGVPLDAERTPDAPTGLAFVGAGGMQATDAKTLGEVGTVVRLTRVNKRDTGKTCSYTGVVEGKLFAYDVDLEAFDANTANSMGKGHLVNESPVCPSTNYGTLGEHNTVASTPPQRAIEAWVRSLSG